MKNETSKRISYIAQAQLIGCLLVIFGHSYPLDGKTSYWMYLLVVFIYTFHMPLFFFVSGYLFQKTKSFNRYTPIEYYKKRSYRLMVPYIALTIVGFIPKVLVNNFISDDASFSWLYLLKCFFMPRCNVWGHFWFLPTLLFISFFSFLFSKINNKSKMLYAVIVLVTFIFPYFANITDWLAINDILKFMCYYALGIFFADSQFERLATNRKIQSYLLLLLPISIGIYAIQIEPGIFYEIRNNIVGLLMVIFVLAVSQSFDITNNRAGRFFIEKNYSVFILSWLFQSVVHTIMENILNIDYKIVMPIAFAVGIGGPIAAILMINWFEKKIGKKFISPIIGG